MLLVNVLVDFIVCPGGRIDHAHHYNNPFRALDETLALDAAASALLGVVDLSETLVVVTSDHSHVLTLGALSAPRGNPILGKYDAHVAELQREHFKCCNLK